MRCILSDYIKNLRKYIGKEPILCVAVGAIIYKERKVLLQKRADNKKWAIHGGSIELGETIEESLMRELKEELGIIPIEPRLYKIFSGKNMHHIYPNGDEIYCINIIYLCDKYVGYPMKDYNEVIELKWFDVDNLPLDISEPIDKIILHDIDKII
jgi:mutator protein MutT